MNHEGSKSKDPDILFLYIMLFSMFTIQSVLNKCLKKFLLPPLAFFFLLNEDSDCHW